MEPSNRTGPAASRLYRVLPYISFSSGDRHTRVRFDDSEVDHLFMPVTVSRLLTMTRMVRLDHLLHAVPKHLGKLW